MGQALTEGQWTALTVLLSQPKPAYLVSSVSVPNTTLEPSGGWTLASTPGVVWTRTAEGLALDYQSNAYDSGEDPVHLSSVNATINYSITGSMTQDGETITVQTHTVCYVESNTHVFGQDAVSHSGNLIDEAWSATYQISPGERAGDFKAVLTNETPISNNSQQPPTLIVFSYGSELLGGCGRDAVSGYADALTAVLSPSARPHSLIPPGGGPGPQPHQGPPIPILPDDPTPPNAPTFPDDPPFPGDIEPPHDTSPPHIIPSGRHQK
jgi:hypothetical protein